MLRIAKFILIAGLLYTGCKNSQNVDWGSYQGDLTASQYSSLDQINKANIDGLKVAWRYQSGDADRANRTQIQCNPLIIDGILYGTSPTLKLFALDATTGDELWRYDPFGNKYDQFGMGVNRGVHFWTDGKDSRILTTAGQYLYAVDANKGSLIRSFGEDGLVDLRDGLSRNVGNNYISSNTPGVIYKDLLILGSRVSESTGPVPGHIRAYNVRTGEIVWTFKTIPFPGEFGYETWPEDAYLKSGGANAWSGMSLDTEREIVFIPTGSASFDYYGGDRHGDNLFANCLLALNANTGERLWHYQFVRHDLWDRDLPAPPNLLEIERDGKKVDVVAQITKSGYVFMFDRETGTPIFQIDEIPAEPSNLVGEYTAATQPLPSAPPPFSRQTIYKEDLATRTDAVAAWTDSIWNISHKNHQFRPLDLIPSLIFPGLDGGGEWGGAATDPQGIMYVNSSQMAWILGMQEFNAEPQKLLAGKGQIIYQTLCQNCHAEDRSGTDLYANIPTLIGLKDRQLKNATTQIIKKGKGIMPAFSNLADKDIDAIVAFLHESDEINNDGESDFWPYPYRFAGFNRFNAPDGHPGIKPPWGLITALDLNEGTIKWQSVLGDVPELRNANDPATGTENYGGPVATAGGIIFIAATKDNKIRAFDSENGKELWSHELPVPGYATPATYAVNGKQYVVIACGGGKIGSPSGDAYIAFALE